MMVDRAAVWLLDEHVRFRRLFDEGVLIHQDRAEALVLNDTAMAFLELCDGRRTAGEIVERMTADFDVGAETLAADLEHFLGELVGSGIITRLQRE